MKNIAYFLLTSAFALGHLLAGPNIYLDLQLNGSDVEGEPLLTTIGGDDVSTFIECIAFNHEIFSALSASSGLPSGKRQHKPVTITKRLDKATPLLYQGMFNNEVGEASFRFYRQNSDTGETEHYQTITLSNLRVVQVRRWMPSNLDPVGVSLPVMEEVAFVYETITITDETTGTSATDSQAPR